MSEIIEHIAYRRLVNDFTDDFARLGYGPAGFQSRRWRLLNRLAGDAAEAAIMAHHATNEEYLDERS